MEIINVYGNKKESVMAGRKKVSSSSSVVAGNRRDVVLQQQSPNNNNSLGLVPNNQTTKNHSFLPRPKRNIQVKNLDDSSGLSWREERELKRALYASLQESRRQNRQQQQEQEQLENHQKTSTPPLPPPSAFNKTPALLPTTKTITTNTITTTTLKNTITTPIINNSTFITKGTHSRNSHHYHQHPHHHYHHHHHHHHNNHLNHRHHRHHLNHRTNHCHKNNNNQNTNNINNNNSNNNHQKASTNSRGRVPILAPSSFNHISPPSLSSTSSFSFQKNHSLASSTAKKSIVNENSRDSMKPVLVGVGTHIRSENIPAAPATTTTTSDIKRTKIHAQRKFAQGSLPSTPNTTPNKAKMSPLCLPKRAKTEDFLTFLCLRGSSVLPSHLDFFNYTNKESSAASGGENSRPQTPANNCKQQLPSCSSSRAQTRESSPLSTTTSTSSTDDVADVLPSFYAIRCLQTPNRQAARACASTPETARGLAAVQQQNLVKKVAGKLDSKLGLSSPSRLRSTQNSSPNKKVVKGKIAQTKAPVRNGLHANDLQNKKRSPGRPPLNRKLKDRGTRLKVSVVPDTKKRTVVVRSGKPGVLRTLTKSQNGNYTTSTQSQKSFNNTPAHVKPVRTAAVLSLRNNTNNNHNNSNNNSVSPVVPFKKMSENLPNRQKATRKGNGKLPSRPVRNIQKKVWKNEDDNNNNSSDEHLSPKKRPRRDVNNSTPSSSSRTPKTRLGTQSRVDPPEPRIQPSRFSKRLSLQLAQRAAVQEELENKKKPPAPKKARLSEPLTGASTPTPVSTALVPKPVPPAVTSLPPLFSLPSPHTTVAAAQVSTTTTPAPVTVNSTTICQNGMHHHHHHHHHFHHLHQRPHHHHHHHHHLSAAHVHHHQQQQQYHHQHQQQQQQMKHKQQQLLTKPQPVKHQPVKQETIKKQNKQQTNKQIPKQSQQQQQQQPQQQQQQTAPPTPLPTPISKSQKQHQPPTPLSPTPTPPPTNTKQQQKQQYHHHQQQQHVQTNSPNPPGTLESLDASSKKKSNSRMPTREQLKLAHIIEKRRGKKIPSPSSPQSASTNVPNNNLTQVVNESFKRKENGSTPERRRGRPPIPKKSPERSMDCAEAKSPAKSFPLEGEAARIVDIPVFHPTEEEFKDPLAYIESIKKDVEPFGMCRIVPPSSWKHESQINEEMRFTSQMQYINRMFNQWGPNVQHVECIQKHLASNGIELGQPPLIGGVELDLSRLHKSIKEQGGMQNVMDKKKWSKVADMVKIPKQAQDRTTKLYNAYCKYLLSYEMLPEEEKGKLLQQVKDEWNQRVQQQRQNKFSHQTTQDECPNKCTAKGKSTSVNTFQRVARNIQSMWFRDDPTSEQVETEYWKIVEEASSHVAVQSGHINSGNQSTFLPNKKENSSANHGWNFNMLSQNPLSVLRHLGPVPGVTLPIVHIGMLFTTSCWSVNRHNLPYVHYLHLGADLIWYSIPKELKSKLKSSLKELVPSRIGDGESWLKEDALMVNPERLVEKGVSVGRTVQKQHQFVVVFPYTYTSSLTCGYSVSECLPYATPDWLPLGQAIAQVLRRNCLWPEMFSLDSLLRRIVKAEPAVSDELLTQALPLLEKAIEHELSLRKQLYDAGLKNAQKMDANEPLVPSSPKRKRLNNGEEENRCEVYKRICYFSMVVNEVDDSLYCLDHALAHIQKKRNLKACRLYYRYSDEDLQGLLKNASSLLNSKESGTVIAESTPKRKSAKVNENTRLKKLNGD